MLNISELGRDVGLKQPTAHRYMNLLEVNGLIFRLPAYSINRGKRLVKSSKIMWLDSGLATYLAGLYSSGNLKKSREWGGMLECFVFHHLKQLASLIIPCPHINYWRTADGYEVNFVIEYGQVLIGIEVKSSSRVTYGDTLHLQRFLKEYSRATAAVVLYYGSQFQQLAKNIYALPITALWS